MPERCRKCNRRKVLGRGWMSEYGRWYCPSCWADTLASREEARRKSEDQAKRRAQETERQRHEIESEIQELRRQLEQYCSRQVPLPPEFAAPSAALAQRGLEIMDSVLRRLEKTKLEYVKDKLEHDKRLVGTLLDVLNRMQIQNASANVSDLIQLCLQLAELLDIRLDYTEGVRFPVNVLIHLDGVDHTRTLQRLCKTACDPDAAPQARVVSIIALGQMGDQRAAESLLRILEEGKDDWGAIIPGAACALVDLGDARAILPIIGVMRQHFYSGSHPHWTARDHIAERMAALVQPGTDRYQQLCTAWRTSKQATTAPDRAVASVIERVLVDCGAQEAVEIASEWARSEQNDVALKGTRALADIDCAEALDVLCAILASPRRVIVGYHDEGDMWDIPDYGPNTEQRILAAKALAHRRGAKTVAVLKSSATDEDAKVRAVVKQLLSE
jgi:HEAT repeat protein